LRVGAIGDTGIFVDVFVRGEKPEFVATNWATDSGDSILAREGLLGIGFRIVERVASVEIFSPIEIGSASVPII
jgi:hypothetical protein